MAIWPLQRYYNAEKPPRDALPDLSHPLAQGLVGDWNMSEGEELLAFDRAGTVRGSPNHGTLVNGPTWTAGDKGGAALEFDGGDDIVQLASPPVTDYPLTLSAWIVPVADTWALSICDASSTKRYWAIRGQVGTGFQYNFRFDNDSGLQFAITAGTPVAGTLYHIVGLSRASDDHELYVNGVSLGTKSTSAPAVGIDRAAIGALWRESVVYGTGRVEAASIYNVALTADDIAQLFSEPYVCYPRARRYWYTSVSAVGVYPIFGGRHVIR